MKRLAFVAAAGVTFLVGCQMMTEELPTSASETPAAGVLKVPIPSIPLGTPAPGPTTSPTPTPTPGPTPTPTPSPTPTPTTGCGDPLPVVSNIKVVIHLQGPVRWTLDATPLVHNAEYCAEIGFPGRLDCPVRPEGDPERSACEEYALGYAEDTGRQGPTWYRDGQLCNGTDCENHPDNQYLVWAYESGIYQACSNKSDVCGGVEVNR